MMNKRWRIVGLTIPGWHSPKMQFFFLPWTVQMKGTRWDPGAKRKNLTHVQEVLSTWAEPQPCLSPSAFCLSLPQAPITSLSIIAPHLLSHCCACFSFYRHQHSIPLPPETHHAPHEYIRRAEFTCHLHARARYFVEPGRG